MDSKRLAHFVELVLKNDHRNVKPVALEVLHAAGFPKVTTLVSGKLMGAVRDEDGSVVDDYVANKESNLVAKMGDKDHNLASTWLDSLWGYIVQNRQAVDLQDTVAELIEKSVPLEPIVLTTDDERLREYPAQHLGSIYAEHHRDDHKIGSCVHDICSGWVDDKEVSPTHNALHCRSCSLRVTYPNNLKTWGELRQYFAQQLQVEC